MSRSQRFRLSLLERKVRRSRRRLGRRGMEWARKTAVDLWNQADGDREKAEELLETQNMASVDPSTIILIVKAIMLLFEIWELFNHKEVTLEPMAEEPEFVSEAYGTFDPSS